MEIQFQTEWFKMKIYIATEAERIDEFNKIKDAIEKYGHTVSHNWTLCTGEPDELKSRFDISAIKRSKMLIALMPGGRSLHVEIGAALALDIKVIIIGDQRVDGKKCVMYSHNLVSSVENIDDLHKIKDISNRFTVEKLDSGDNIKEFGMLVRRSREQCGIRIGDGARMLGISVVELCDVELGKNKFSEQLQYIEAITEFIKNEKR